MDKLENMNRVETKTAMLRARVKPALKRDVNRLAEFKDLDEADIVRIACSRLIEQFKSAGNAMNLL
jgi:hypothetical protein